VRDYRTGALLFGLGGVNMGDGERSGSGDRNDWPVRIAGCLGAAAVGGLALLVSPDLGGFWPGALAFVAAIGVGGVLGRLAGVLLFRPSSGDPPDHPDRA
jgi:hypothetical protein